ncbi:MAG: hypothetical protein KJ000_06585 [Pirellulaceae bacterium]|nr:hypothetical protein [Pirellulaceae bacterium]
MSSIVVRRVILVLVFLGSLAGLSPVQPSAILHAAEGSDSVSDPSLEQNFLAPPDAYKPWVYWWWLYGNVTERSITRDLEGMKEKGIGGLLLFDARGYHDHIQPPPSRMEFMSPEWRKMVRFAISEADRLGLKMSVNLSSCAGTLTGPWQVGEDVPKQLAWAATDLEGPQQYEGDLPRGDWGKFWEVAVVGARRDDHDTVVQVVDLSDRVAGGKLSWQTPPGRWRLIRFVAQTVEGRECDVDILDAGAVRRHFDRMGGRFLEDAGDRAGKTLTHFYNVSWEGVAAAWSLGFEDEFKTLRGYELRPYLPALAGMVVGDPAKTERFHRDYQKTLAETFMNNFYGQVQTSARAAGLQWHSESGGPWDRKLPIFAHADQLAFLGRTDMPQGEFWHPNRAINRPAAMASHIYGRPLAATEAFTHMVRHFSVYPALLKPGADLAFCDGINHFIWHTFSASPEEFGLPGIHYWAGSHLNPNVTWWQQSGAFLAYLARCQFLLQQGHFVADACVYTGDATYLHWGRGERWSSHSSLTLPKGYAYDLLNTEVLLERLSVEHGRLVLPDGMSYRMLVVDLDSDEASPEALQKIHDLAARGATVVLGSRRPKQSPGLRDYPDCDARVQRLAARLWSDGDQAGARTLGEGCVVSGMSLDDALRHQGLAADFEGAFEYIHRRIDDTDIYFLAGAGKAECLFRVQGREPEFWDPVTGRVRDAGIHRQTEDGRTAVPLDLPKDGAVFVVFRRPQQEHHLIAVSGPDGVLEIAADRGEESERTPSRLRLWQNGRYELTDAQGERRTVVVEDLSAPRTLNGPWEVRFAPGWGAPESTVFDRLIPWNEHSDPAIKYFSGTANYRIAFDLNDHQAGSLVRLQLGEVRNIAEVRANGQSLGVVWTAPWTVDLTGHVKSGKNFLEIDVINLWVNRLIGDARLPADQRLTRPFMRLESDPTVKLGRRCEGYTAADELEPSGLLGEVRLEFGEESP